MKKVLFGIFAHPDDEAFGPSATLYKEVQAGTDVHLVLVTDGENGTNCDNRDNLAQTRIKEWRKSGELIGVTTGLPLHYPDGELSNSLYVEIAEKILVHIQNTLDSYDESVLLELMTFESSGVSGHLDHIAVSQITTFVYLKLKEAKLSGVVIGELKYFCLPDSVVGQPNINWIYMPRGRSTQEVDERIDYSDILDIKLEIMKAHYSQRQDMEQVLSTQDTNNPDCFCDHFCYFKD